MRKRTTLALLGSILAAVLVVAAVSGCGSKKKSTHVTPAAEIAAAGKIVFCSDTTNPPEESFVKGQLAGSDLDIAAAISGLMGVKTEFRTTSFDRIVPALLAIDNILIAWNLEKYEIH